MLKRLFFGRSGRLDVDAPPLVRPKTRRELFSQALRVRFTSLFAPNLAAAAFFLPAFVWTEMTLRVAPGGADEAAGASSQLVGTYLIGLFVCLMITGPVMAGLSLLMRNWARGENCYRWATLFGGMKRNWRQGLLAGALSGVIPLLFYSTFNYYGALSENTSLLYLIPLALCGVLCLFLLLMQQTIYTLLVTYRLSFGKVFKNALLLAFSELPRSLLTLLVTLLPPLVFVALLYLLPLHTGLLVVLCCVYYALFGISFERFVAASFANYACEKHLNSRLDGARVDIGLSSERTVGGQPPAAPAA